MMTLTNQQWLMLAGAGAALLWYLKTQTNGAFDPTDQNNVANRAFNDWYAGGVDGEGTLGTDVADLSYEYSPYVLADKAREGLAEWWRDL